MTALLPVPVHSPRDQHQRLAATRSRVVAARDRRAEAQRSYTQAREADDRDAMRIAAAELDQAHGELEVAQELQNRALSALAGVNDDAGRTLRYDVQAQNTLKEIANSTAPLREYIRVGDFCSADELCSMLTGRALAAGAYAALTVPNPATDFGGQYIGHVPTPQVPLTLLDFFQSVPLRERRASWMQRQGGVAQAGVQTPGSIKAAANLTYTAEDADVVTVASWIKAARQDLDDLDTLQNDLAEALSYGVRVVVEQQLVTAITTATGIGAPNVTADGNTPDKVLTAVGLLTASGVQPNFVGLHPTDATKAFKEREGTNGTYLTGSPWDRLPPIVQSSALTVGTALVGDSTIDARMGVRSGLSISVGEESEDFKRNMATILSEARVAPMVLVPAAFSKFSIAGA